MKRVYTGNLNVSNVYQKTGKSPLDDRDLVYDYSDLLDSSTFVVYVDGKPTLDETWYEGMVVTTINTNEQYMLINKGIDLSTGKRLVDPTDEKCWKKLGGGVDSSLCWQEDIYID